jgi:formylmethanofuran dehydrogenase subunit C
VELLNQVSGLLPADGLRLTAFESSNGKIVIKGEASNPPAAFKFSEDIKAKPDLQMFNWEMPNPSLRADGRADFTIEGVPKVAKIEQK